MTLKEFYDYCSFGKIYTELNDHDKISMKHMADKYVNNNVRFVAILFTFIQGLYFADALVTKAFMKDHGILNLASILLMLLSSVLVIVLTSIKSKKIIKSIQYITFGYYLVLNVSMFCWLAATMINNSPYATSVFYLYLILAICPIPILLLNVLEFLLVIIAASFVFAYVPSSVATGGFMMMYSMIIIGFLASLHIRKSYVNGFYHQYQARFVTAKLEKLSTTDFLTDLGNRTALDNFKKNDMQEAIYYRRIIGVAMIDIDNFKSFNDYYGHMVGDKALKDIAHCILDVSAKYEMYPFRYGGEEFLICDTISNEGRFKAFQDELLSKIRSLSIFRQDLDDEHMIVTVSIGSVTHLITSLDDFDYAIKLADDNLYESKKNGKNQYTFTNIEGER